MPLFLSEIDLFLSTIKHNPPDFIYSLQVYCLLMVTWPYQGDRKRKLSQYALSVQKIKTFLFPSMERAINIVLNSFVYNSIITVDLLILLIEFHSGNEGEMTDTNISQHKLYLIEKAITPTKSAC